MSSYDDLLKQVESLKAENSHLRQELNDNTGILDSVCSNGGDQDSDSDTDINYDDEDGIHVFQQGGGGEGRDLTPDEEDISPNDIGPLKSFNHTPHSGSHITKEAEPAWHPPHTPTHQGAQSHVIKESDPSLHTSHVQNQEILHRLKSLYHERSAILTYIEEEDRQRKWFITQLDNIRQKLEKIPVTDGFSKEAEHARRKIEYEAKQIQESFLQNLGTHEQISQRQEARLQRISAIETEVLQIQQQRKAGVNMESSMQATPTQPSQENNSGMDPNSSINLASLYHGAWPLSPMKRDSSNHSSREGSTYNVSQQEIASVMSFNSSNTNGSHSSMPPPASPRQHGQQMVSHNAVGHSAVMSHDGGVMGQPPQQLGTKVEMVYSLLSMLGTHDKDDMSRTLLAMSSSQDSCIAMRQSGCMPLLIQLLHGSDKDSGLLGNTRGSQAARARAAAALHNIVHSHPDDKRGRREARVLRLLEQIRAHCDQLRETSENGGDPADIKDMDHHPGPAVAALMKLSFDEEHRHAICSLGGVQAIAELIEVDHDVHHTTVEQYNVTMRRYSCMALTNLTFGDGTNKALLCSMRGFMESLVAQLQSQCEDLNQVAASVLRNLSWKADLQSKKTLRSVKAATTLMSAAMNVKKEPTLKSILSALWNLSAHGSENKAEICAVEGALEFLVGTLTYKSPSKTTAVIENGGGVLRNISSHITVREDYRQILRKHGCLQILLKQLRSPSLNIVSNACGTLWNLSARCAEDQKALLDMGAVGMLRNLVNSKHQMISMGSSAALKNLLTACNIKSMGMDKKACTNRPSLHVRKQKALVEEIDQSLSETCENVESPRDSPTENGRNDKEPKFTFPANANVVNLDAEGCRVMPRMPIYPKSSSGENTPMSDSRLMSPSRVARSGSQDSVGSTHSDISHDRNRFHNVMKNAKMEGQGGSLDRQQGNLLQKLNSENDRNPQHANSRIIQVMKEVAKHAGIDPDSNSKANVMSRSQSNTPRKNDGFSLPHTLLYRSFTGPATGQPAFTVPASGQAGFNPYSSHCNKQQHMEDQPIDYSMNKSNKQNIPSPATPKYGNFTGQTFDQNTYPMMHHSYGGPQKSAQNLFSLAPMIQHSNVYAETDLDCERPTDYSRRFAENHDDSDCEQPINYGMQYEDNCADCKLDIARRTNDRLEFMPGYNEDQIKTFCTEGTPRNYLSTANSLTDLSKGEKGDNSKQEVYEEEEGEEDYVKQHYNDGESGSNTCYGEMEKRSGSGSQSTNQNTGTTVIANYHVATKNLQQVAASKSPSQDEAVNQSFHAPNENDNSPDQLKTYCEEGTPICFSRVSSLSSLHSSEAQDRQMDTNKPIRQTRGLHSIDENNSTKSTPVKTVNSIMAAPKYTPNTGRQKLLSESDSQGPEGTEKEHKTVTFNDDHQVQETPLMFSRCSSLGSLSSFDAHSVHSSVISDYSRRASEVVSPSELPDSPSETMPPSPSKSPEPGQSLKTRSNIPKLEDFMGGTPKTVLFRPIASKMTNERSVHNIEVGSTMSRDEAPVVYADEGTPPHMSETNSILSNLTIDDANKHKGITAPVSASSNPNEIPAHKAEDQNDDKENSSMSEVSEGEEDILKECMKNAMPRKLRRSSSDNALKKKAANSRSDKNKMTQSADGIKSPKPKHLRSLHASISETSSLECDSVKTYASEDIIQEKVTPSQTNQSKIVQSVSVDKGLAETSMDTVKSFAEEDVPFSEKRVKPSVLPQPKVDSGSKLVDDSIDSVTPYANEGQPSNKNTKNIPLRPKQVGTIQAILSGKLDALDAVDDCVTSYAEEGTPFTGSAPMSPQSSNKPHFMQNTVRFNPALLSQVDYMFDEEEAPKSYAMEDTPYNLSEPTSPKNTVKKAPPPVAQKPKRPSAIPKFDPSLLSQLQQDIPDDDAPTSYAMEDTPFNLSKPSSPKNFEKVPFVQPDKKFSLKSMRLEDDAALTGEDTIKTFATEDTPISFSHATSLSDLSIITGMSEPIKEEPEEETEKSHNEEVGEKTEEEEENKLDETQSDNSSMSDDNDDLLSDLIQSAMPKGRMSPKGKCSRKLDMDRAAEGAESKTSPDNALNFQFKPQRTSSIVTTQKETYVKDVKNGCVNIDCNKSTSKMYGNGQNSTENARNVISVDSEMPSRIEHVYRTPSVSHAASYGTSAGDDSVFYQTNDSADSVRVYNIEGTPTTFSRNDSLSSLSIIDDDSKNLSKKSETSDSAKKMPPPNMTPKTFSKTKSVSEIELQREVEGQSSDEISLPSLTELTDDTNEQNDSNGNDDNEDDDLNDDALLEACMNLALPKSKSATFAEKKKIQKTSPTSSFTKTVQTSTDQPRKGRKSLDLASNRNSLEKHKMSRSNSAAEENLNRSIGSVTSHHSRASQWQQQQYLNTSADFVFMKPSNNYKRPIPNQGSWRRSRSQDSDGFLKQKKDTSNMEIARSVGNVRPRYRNSEQSIPTYVDDFVDNRMMEEMNYYHQQNGYPSSHVKHGQIEKTDHQKHLSRSYNVNSDPRKRSHSENREKSYIHQSQNVQEYQMRRRHFSANDNPEKCNKMVQQEFYMVQQEMDSMNRSIYQVEHNREALNYSMGIDNFGFGFYGSQEDMNEDNADVTLNATTSGNNTMTNENSFQQNRSAQEYQREALSPEHMQTLRIDASAVVTEIQNKRMAGSAVDDDMFIEHETLSLVSGGYMSDTNSEVSITMSAHSENFSESTTEEYSITSNGPRILKPSDKVQCQEQSDTKAIRGKRKPLYSPRSNSSASQKSDAPSRLTKPAGSNIRTTSGGAANVSRKAPQTKTHPQASSTPTKSTKVKPLKVSPPQVKQGVNNNKSTVSKGSPSRLPLAANRKGSSERPKPPIKQGTFTKDAPTSNIHIVDLDDTLDENSSDSKNTESKKVTNSSTKKVDSTRGSESWKKALGSYNFVIENAEDKKENQTPNRRGSGVTNLSSKKSGSGSDLNKSKNSTGNSPGIKTTVKANNRVNSSSNLKKTYSGTSLTKSGSGASLNKSGSGNMLNKSGSGSLLNKSGSALNRLAGSDRGLNRGGSNPNLQRITSKGDLKKSDSNASLKNNSRPTTPVGRRTSSSSIPGKKVDSGTKVNHSGPENKKPGVASVQKKQVGSKIAGLWKKEESGESPSPRSSTSKLPVSTSTPTRQKMAAASNIKKTNTAPVQAINKTTSGQDSTQSDGISRSSTYDKINSCIDSSQLPSLDDDAQQNSITVELSPTKSNVVLGDEVKGDYVELRIIQGSESDFDMNKSIIIKSPTKSKSESDSVVSPSDTSSMSRSGDEFDLKSLEKRIDSSTWKKKKSDLDSSYLPNADETSKSLEAVKALLDASIASESTMHNSTVSSVYNTSTVEGSYLSQGSRTIGGSSWRRNRQDSYASVDHSEDEGDSIWVRRDPESSKSEPELNKHSLNPKKQKKEKTESKSFLPIKAMKSMFSSSKKDKSSKSGSKLSLSSSKESLYSNKINMNEIVKAVEKEREKEKKEKAKQKEKVKEKPKPTKDKSKAKDKSKNEKEKNKVKKEGKRLSVGNDESFTKSADSSVSLKSPDNSSFQKPSPPQAALVQPFNYTPKETSAPVEFTEIRDQDGFVKPQPIKPTANSNANIQVPKNSPGMSQVTYSPNSNTQTIKTCTPNSNTQMTKTSTPSSNTHVTKTEMLLARRRMNSLNQSGLDSSVSENEVFDGSKETKKQGCMVTTV